MHACLLRKEGSSSDHTEIASVDFTPMIGLRDLAPVAIHLLMLFESLTRAAETG
jgi:hypothetical protein